MYMAFAVCQMAEDEALDAYGTAYARNLGSKLAFSLQFVQPTRPLVRVPQIDLLVLGAIFDYRLNQYARRTIRPISSISYRVIFRW